jgi:hypothetical protein
VSEWLEVWPEVREGLGVGMEVRECLRVWPGDEGVTRSGLEV